MSNISSYFSELNKSNMVTFSSGLVLKEICATYGTITPDSTICPTNSFGKTSYL